MENRYDEDDKLAKELLPDDGADAAHDENDLGEYFIIKQVKSLQEARDFLGLRNAQLAKELGYNTHTVYQWMVGLRNPHAAAVRQVIGRLAKLGVKITAKDLLHSLF